MGNTHGSSFSLFDMTPQPAMNPPRDHENPFDVLPLSFDRVYPGHISTSRFPLFQLPVELFPQVLQYLSKQDLKALALVDKDCRKLAALSQFRHVRMDFTESSCTLTKLLHSGSQHEERHPTGCCIRRMDLVVNNDAGRLVLFPQESLAPELGYSLSDYLTTLAEVVESLPNLHIVDWNLPLSIHTRLLKSVFSTKTKHLRLNGPILLDDVDVSPAQDTFPLESLSIHASWPRVQYRGQNCHFFDRLLRSCSQTLRQLEWVGQTRNDDIHISTNDMPLFPNLRTVIIDKLPSQSDGVLEHFLGPYTRVVTLALDSTSNKTCEFYRTRGNIPSLRQLCWINTVGALQPLDDVTAFLAENTQLETVQVTDPLETTFIDEILLPLLIANFSCLTSLKLVWWAQAIHEDSLKLIATIPTLRHLWLSAGNQESCRSTWRIDIDAVLEHLSPLVHLRTLGFSHDTYDILAHPLAPRFCDYYATKAMPSETDVAKYLSPHELDVYLGKRTKEFNAAFSQQIVMRRVAWERWHAEKMQAIVMRLAGVFQGLEWCFVGQLAVDVFEGQYGKETSLSSSTREPCLSSLHKKMAINVWRPGGQAVQ